MGEFSDAHRVGGNTRRTRTVRRVRNLRGGSRQAAGQGRPRGDRVLPIAADDDDGPRPKHYEGMGLVHLPAIRTKSLETLSHTALSVAHMMRHPAGRRNRVQLGQLTVPALATRTRHSGRDPRGWVGVETFEVAGRRAYVLPDRRSLRRALLRRLIADAEGIARYYAAEFGAETRDRLRRAGPGRPRTPSGSPPSGSVAIGYHLVVARFEPENHLDLIIEGYCRSSAQFPLVVVGLSSVLRPYTAQFRELADERVRFLGGVWDQDLLDQLYTNAPRTCTGTQSVAPIPRCFARSVPARRPSGTTSASTARCFGTPGGSLWTPTGCARSLRPQRQILASCETWGGQVSDVRPTTTGTRSRTATHTFASSSPSRACPGHAGPAARRDDVPASTSTSSCTPASGLTRNRSSCRSGTRRRRATTLAASWRAKGVARNGRAASTPSVLARLP